MVNTYIGILDSMCNMIIPISNMIHRFLLIYKLWGIHIVQLTNCRYTLSLSDHSTVEDYN